MAQPAGQNKLPNQTPNSNTPVVEVEADVSTQLKDSEGKPITGTLRAFGYVTPGWRYLFGKFLTAVNTFSATAAGVVPASGGGTTTFLRADGTFANPLAGISAPNVQVFAGSQSGTYTTPTSGGKLPLYIRVRMVGGGGGAGAIATNAGGGGSASQFENWVANPGNGSPAGQNHDGGSGGSGGANGTGTQITRISGENGTGTINNSTSGGYRGGKGGSTPFGGAGTGKSNGSGGGFSAAANSGSGGGGANNGSIFTAGGGASEYVEFLITSPVSSYIFTVGAGGGGGAAGTQPGGSGADGRIEVIAYWQ